MVRKVTVSIPCRLGIHARCAVRIIEFLNQFKSEVRVRKGGKVADAKSILELMSLGASYQTQLEFEIFGPNAESVRKAVENFFRAADYCEDHQK